MLYCNQVLVLQLGVTCHILFIGIPSSNNIGYAPATICLELRAEFKVTVNPKTVCNTPGHKGVSTNQI